MDNKENYNWALYKGFIYKLLYFDQFERVFTCISFPLAYMVVSNEKLNLHCMATVQSAIFSAKYADTQLSSVVHRSLSLYTDCRASEGSMIM